MSTLDVVNQAGGRGRRTSSTSAAARTPTSMATSLEVILFDPSVEGVLINIFGGITRGDVVAKGILEALGRVDAAGADRGPPRRHQRRGGPADPRRRGHPRIVPAATMLEAAERAAALGARGGPRSDGDLRRRSDTKVVVAGHHRARGHVPRAAQPRVRHPGRRRRDARARAGRTSRASRSSTRWPTRSSATGANASLIFVPRPVRRRGDPRGGRRRASTSSCASPRASPPRTWRRSCSYLRGHRTPRSSGRTAPASSAPARQRRHHPGRDLRAGPASGSSAARARSPTRSCTSSRSAASASPRASASAATRCTASGSSTSLERVRGRPRDRRRRDDRRDRRRRRGAGRRVHRRRT